MIEVYLLQERWSKAWSVKDASSRNEIMKIHLLFLHSSTGCATTSSVFGKGKPKLVKAQITSDTWKHLYEVMSRPWNDQIEVGDASIKLLHKDGHKEDDALPKLRT